MGGSQEPPGRPAKLPPLRTLLATSISDNQRYMSLVSSFRAVLRSVIGLVFLRKQCHSVGLGIRYTVVSLHADGTKEVCMHSLISSLR